MFSPSPQLWPSLLYRFPTLEIWKLYSFTLNWYFHLIDEIRGHIHFKKSILQKNKENNIVKCRMKLRKNGYCVNIFVDSLIFWPRISSIPYSKQLNGQTYLETSSTVNDFHVIDVSTWLKLFFFIVFNMSVFCFLLHIRLWYTLSCKMIKGIHSTFLFENASKLIPWYRSRSVLLY